MPILYLDEDVSVILGRVLAGRGIDTLTAKDAEMLGKRDEEQLTFSTEKGRVLVTHNRRDFEHLHSIFLERQLEHAGIIIAARRDVYEVARRGVLLLNAVPPESFRNQLFYI